MDSDRKERFWPTFLGYVIVFCGCVVAIVLTYRTKEVGSLIGEFMWPFDAQSARWTNIVACAVVGTVALVSLVVMLRRRFSGRNNRPG